MQNILFDKIEERFIDYIESVRTFLSKIQIKNNSFLLDSRKSAWRKEYVGSKD